jgi:hypothetical protein
VPLATPYSQPAPPKRGDADPTTKGQWMCALLLSGAPSKGVRRRGLTGSRE